MKTFPRSNLIASISLAALALASTSALADFTFNLTNGNTAISGYAPPYATVDVHWVDSTHATITFTSAIVGGNIYLLGDGGSVDVNVNATSWTLSNIAGSNAGTGFTPGAWSNGGSGQVDGFGVFNQTINSFDGFTHSSDTISFNLQDTSGTWADATSVLVANNPTNNALAAAHIFVTASPANGANGALATGFASTGGSHNTPEPGSASLALLALGLLGAGFWTRRKA